ncbi:FAN Factor [Thecamonas trahens ATCC 50062]|uniref:FAN Factor n=1 Tax=Thecamonas trahens ATCC 50062 TaxID=461836 RepID=A0A0L0DEH8_THETB|nr:FAN Factor [Thecamonas trahens ATCC 50062]KNC50605.1 FAN Factor [Thecamonas trahens ATCC 50062]|eukprot:XP_013762492.1 FAN Factor [Thecamonas trahens ATCC 50062]
MAASSSRFSLLLLEEGEYYFDDYAAYHYPSLPPSPTTRLRGRVRLCSSSLFFEPEDVSHPLVKLSFAKVHGVSRFRGLGGHGLASDELAAIFVIQTSLTITLLGDNVIKPYTFTKGRADFAFALRYAELETFLPRLQDLLEISTLDVAGAEARLDSLIAIREAKLTFDHSSIKELSERIELEMRAVHELPLVHNPGRFVLTTARIYFQAFNNISGEPVASYDRSAIRSVARRRHLLRATGLEIFMASGDSMLFSFSSRADREAVFEALYAQDGVASQQEEFAANMTLRWQNGLVSNYEYLMFLNSMADRSFNDLAQYPVFPWVVADYTSAELDLDNPATFRDLSKPVGALNPDRLAGFRQRFEQMPADGTGPLTPFLYGTHYSTPGYVLFYLVRSQPALMLRLQNGKFDAPDRLFTGVAATWRNCLHSTGDVKELIPEFYAGDGSFLRNTAGIDFGVCQGSGERVHDVELPPWASDAADFVTKLRSALESKYVSDHLHEWIDLVFGHKQRGAAADAADNVFYYLTYEGAVDIEAIADPLERKAIELQISEFGQTPTQLFTRPHPRRGAVASPLGIGLPAISALPTSGSEAAGGDGGASTVNASPVAGAPDSAASSCGWGEVGSLVEDTAWGPIAAHKGAVTGLVVSDDGARITSVSLDGYLRVYAMPENRQVRAVAPSSLALSSVTALDASGDTFVVGGWDNAVYAYSIEYGSISAKLESHDAAVSGVVMVDELTLVSTSWDSTVKVWERKSTRNASSHLCPWPRCRSTTRRLRSWPSLPIRACLRRPRPTEPSWCGTPARVGQSSTCRTMTAR